MTNPPFYWDPVYNHAPTLNIKIWVQRGQTTALLCRAASVLYKYNMLVDIAKDQSTRTI